MSDEGFVSGNAYIDEALKDPVIRQRVQAIKDGSREQERQAEMVAELIAQALERDENGWVDAQNLDAVIIDGTFDLRAIAECMIRRGLFRGKVGA